MAEQNEKPTERAARYMGMLNGQRDELRAYVRTFRDTSNGKDVPMSTSHCDDVIDLCLSRLAKSTLNAGVDYQSADEMMGTLSKSIQQRFEEHPDRGSALGQ